MGTFSLAAATVVGKPLYLHCLYSHFLLPSSPLLHFNPSYQRNSPNRKSPAVTRGCSSVTAKPSSELRRKSGRSDSGHDDKLRALRELFSKPGVGVDAYIIPSQDAHQSEFIAECYMRRAYISGFTGSAGTAVVTRDKAALWTDGRYFLQAEKQLSSSWILMRAGNIGVPTTAEWLNDVLDPGCKVGIDPFLFSFDAAEELREDLSKKNHELVLLYNTNLVDEIWKQSRPKPPSGQVRLHNLKYAGVDVSLKLSALRSHLTDAGCTAIVISRLDEIAWLLNLRGDDVPHSPVMYAYMVVEIDGAKLFIDGHKVTAEVMNHLLAAGVELKPYESILDTVENLALEGACLWIDASSVNAAIVNTFKSVCDEHSGNLRNRKKYNAETHATINGKFSDGPTGVYRSSPLAVAKAVKNEAEIEGMRNSHLRDAAALAEFWAWLEDEILKGATITEVEIADQLLEFRSKQDGFMDTSFDTISVNWSTYLYSLWWKFIGLMTYHEQVWQKMSQRMHYAESINTTHSSMPSKVFLLVFLLTTPAAVRGTGRVDDVKPSGLE